MVSLFIGLTTPSDPISPSQAPKLPVPIEEAHSKRNKCQQMLREPIGFVHSQRENIQSLRVNYSNPVQVLINHICNTRLFKPNNTHFF